MSDLLAEFEGDMRSSHHLVDGYALTIIPWMQGYARWQPISPSSLGPSDAIDLVIFAKGRERERESKCPRNLLPDVS